MQSRNSKKVAKAPLVHHMDLRDVIYELARSASYHRQYAPAPKRLKRKEELKAMVGGSDA